MPSALELPSRDTKVYWYLGVDGELAQGSQGNLDLEYALEFVALSNAYAPAGVGGEAIFTDIRIATFRDNDTDMVLELTPIIDGVDQETIELTLPAVASAARAIHEIGLAVYYPSSADPQIANAMRGTWFQLEIRTADEDGESIVGESVVGRLDGRLVIEGIELEYEVVTEGKEADNAS